MAWDKMVDSLDLLGNDCPTGQITLRGERSAMNILVANGNLKIGKSTLILNMSSSKACESRRKRLCAIPDKCYAAKAERQYPATLPYRTRQDEIWRKTSAKSIAEQIVTIAKRKRVPIKYLRFSEAGDFRTQADVRKMSEVARLLKPHKVRVYGYTARRDLAFDGISDNMVVNGSGFVVTNEFTVGAKEELTGLVCPGDCRTCNICTVAHGSKVMVELH